MSHLDIQTKNNPIRLITVKKCPNFNGYGFNLHTENKRHFIGYVDENSPAKRAGLLLKDKIVEVNGVRLYDGSHEQIVAEIKQNPDQVTFLVATSEAIEQYEKKSIEIHSELEEVTVIDADQSAMYEVEDSLNSDSKNEEATSSELSANNDNIKYSDSEEAITSQGDDFGASDLDQITIAEVKEKNRLRKMELIKQRKKKMDSRERKELFENL